MIPQALPRASASTARRSTAMPTRSIVRPVRRYVRRHRRAPRRRARAVVLRRRRDRQDDAGDARLQGRARAPAARSRSTRCRGCSPRSARPSTTAATAPTSTCSTAWPPSTCCTSTTSAPRSTSPWVLEQLYSIINARYEERALDRRSRPTSTATQLAEQIGERTVSRLEEMCVDAPRLRARPPDAQRVLRSRLDSGGYARHRDRRRPMGRRGQGQDHRPARRAGRRRRALPGRQQRRPHDRPRRRDVEAPPDPVAGSSTPASCA